MRTMASAIGIAKIRPDPLEQKPQHESQRQQPKQGVDDVSNRVHDGADFVRLRGAELGGEFGRTSIGCRHRVCDDSTKPGRIENLERRGGRAALGSDLFAQHRQGVGRLASHLRSAERRLQRQLMGNLIRQPTLMGRRFERLHEQEKIGRAAAGQAR